MLTNLQKTKAIRKEMEARQNLLEIAKAKIIEIQTRPYISVSEATQPFGMSKDTVQVNKKSKRNIILGRGLGYTC